MTQILENGRWTEMRDRKTDQRIDLLEAEIEAVKRTAERSSELFPKNAASQHVAAEGHIHRFSAGGGISFYDYVIDDSYTGFEGLVLTGGTGHETRIYSTIAGAFGHADGLASNTQRSFLIVSGTYTEQVTLTPPSGTDTRWDIHGMGGGTIWKTSGNSQTLLTLGNASAKMNFRDIVWDLSTHTSGIAITNNALGTYQFTFTKCLFQGNSGTALSLQSTDYLGVQNCTFDGGITGVSGSTVLSKCEINGNFFTCGTGVTGSGNRNYITDNIFDCSTRDISLGTLGCAEMSIVSNQFNKGINVGVTGAPGIDNFNCADNNFRDSSLDFSSLQANSEAINVTGNNFSGTGGIILDANMISGVVAHNTFDDTATITGTGGANLDVFHNIAEVGALTDQGAPVGHSTTAVAAPSDARYFVLGLNASLTNELSISEADSSTIDAGTDLLWTWAEANRRDFQITNVTALGTSTYTRRASSGDSGTATANTTTTITDSTKNWVLNYWAGATLLIGGVYRRVTSNTSGLGTSTLTFPAMTAPGNVAYTVAHDMAYESYEAAETFPRMALHRDRIQWGPGSTAADVALIRTSSSNLVFRRLLTNAAPSLQGMASNDLTGPRWEIAATRVAHGPGGALAVDTAMTRILANVYRFGVSQTAGVQPAIDFFTPNTVGHVVAPTVLSNRLYSALFANKTRMFVQNEEGIIVGPLGFPEGVLGQTPMVGLGGFTVNAAAAPANLDSWGTLSGHTVSATTVATAMDGVGLVHLNLTTSAVSGNEAGVSWPLHIETNGNPMLQVRFTLPLSIANIRMFIGYTNQTFDVMVSADQPAGQYFGLQYSSDRADVNWQFIAKEAGGAFTIVDTLAPVTQATFILRLIAEVPNNLLSCQLFDNVRAPIVGAPEVTTATVNGPAAGTDLRVVAAIETRTGATKTFQLDAGQECTRGAA